MSVSATKPVSTRLIIAVLVLLTIFASRILILNQMQFHQDEARSAMRMFGTTAQIIAWQPPDWPPLHNVVLGWWQHLAGPLPFSLRSLSVFFFMLGVAFTYRAARRLFSSEPAAWGAVVVYAALGYSVYLSTFVRAYVLAMALFSLALWLTLRYFHLPTWRRALPLGLTLAALFYSTYTAVFAFGILGLYSLLTRPRAVWRWWLPGLFALLLAVPELMSKAEFFMGRVESAVNIFPELDPLPQAMTGLLQDFAGHGYIIWLVVSVLALALFITEKRLPRTVISWVLAGMFLGPISLYILAAIPIVYFFEGRYAWWVFVLIGLGLGYGLSRLPRTIRAVTFTALVILMFTIPINARYKPNHHRPFEQNFRWLQQQIEPGDVMLVDPDFCLIQCNEADSWGYYYDTYLRQHIEIVQEPANHRRVWYVRADGWHDTATEQAVLENRIPTIFVGPWDFLIRLYQGPPDPEGILFENGLRFHGMDVMDGGSIMRQPYYWREQTTARVRLWWSIDRPLDADYSISVQVQNREGRLVAQNDGPPRPVHLSLVDTSELPAETSRWEPGRYYIDERDILLPNLGSEIYANVLLTVYQWWDGVRLQAPSVNDDRLLPLTPVTIWGWG
ncbi:MAG TPA: glycosyltransferase family 39 protein [Spirillospora sp.]|nr:glycosyltransferase family 39 protein [Spirillospora sp.]